MLQTGSKDAFNAAIAEAAAKDPMLAQAMAARGRAFAQPTAYDTFKAATGYNLRDAVTEIHTPVLITDPDGQDEGAGLRGVRGVVVVDPARRRHGVG